MNWENETVLVTGAGGFIGSHLTERLVGLGARTKAFIRYNSSQSCGWLSDSEVRDDVEFIFGDICDRDSLRPGINNTAVVFHLAALIGIPYSYRAPHSYVSTNIEGSLNVFDLAREYSVGTVVHTSTSEVYGSPLFVPIDESHPLQGQSPYAASKIGADKMAEAMHLSFDLPVKIIRPFNTFGPRQSARAVIPTIIGQALTQDRITIGSPHPTRDFNYVADTVQGFVRVAESEAAVGEVMNIGSGVEISIGDLVAKIQDLTGTDLPVVSESERVRPSRSEVDRLCANSDKADRMAKWKPEVAMHEGLTMTVDWMRGNVDHYRPASYTV
jgi:NAD dependent epimerase/dehydratase